MTSPSSDAARPKKYAYIELFGHKCLGVCEVEEIDHYGTKMCQARPLGKDGKPGAAHRFPGPAIYCDLELSEEEAIQRASRVYGLLPPPVPRCATCGYGPCDCSDAERSSVEDSAEASEAKSALVDLDLARQTPDDGTPLCTPAAGDEDEIPF